MQQCEIPTPPTSRSSADGAEPSTQACPSQAPPLLRRAPLLLRGHLGEPCLPVQIVDRLAYRVPALACGILHVAGHAIGCAFAGHLIVAGKIADALLDRACG